MCESFFGLVLFIPGRWDGQTDTFLDLLYLRNTVFVRQVCREPGSQADSTEYTRSLDPVLVTMGLFKMVGGGHPSAALVTFLSFYL